MLCNIVQSKTKRWPVTLAMCELQMKTMHASKTISSNTCYRQLFLVLRSAHFFIAICDGLVKRTMIHNKGNLQNLINQTTTEWTYNGWNLFVPTCWFQAQEQAICGVGHGVQPWNHEMSQPSILPISYGFPNVHTFKYTFHLRYPPAFLISSKDRSCPPQDD